MEGGRHRRYKRRPELRRHRQNPIDVEGEDMQLFIPDRNDFNRGGSTINSIGRPGGSCDEIPLNPHHSGIGGGGGGICRYILYLMALPFVLYVIYYLGYYWTTLFNFFFGFYFCKTNDERDKGMEYKEAEINEIIKKEILNYDLDEQIANAIKIYDSDKTGLPDLALKSTGGKIISTKQTKNINPQLKIFGIAIYSPDDAERIIKPGIMAGECWEFVGEGEVIIKLMAPAFITGFTMEHLPKLNSPQLNINSAPKYFELWGLNDENMDSVDKTHLFGKYEYKDNGKPVQYFQTMFSSSKFFQYVELKIKSNQGGSDTTCVYRIRIHGNVQPNNTIFELFLNKLNKYKTI